MSHNLVLTTVKTNGKLLISHLTPSLAQVLCSSHIFDGESPVAETAAFQLCDLQDPMLKEMVEDEDDLREVCNVSRCFLELCSKL
jgi:hypothetical protein